MGLLPLSCWSGIALAQEIEEPAEQVTTNARAQDPLQEWVKATTLGEGQLRSKARAGIRDWGTGGFELRAERHARGRRMTAAASPDGRWQRTYAAGVNFWESVAPGIALEAGGRLERTSRGAVSGPLLTNHTRAVSQTAYAGVTMNDSASVRLIAFDHGGWSEGAAAGQLLSRLANGEPAARKGTAIEIGMLTVRPQNAGRKQQFTLRMEQGRFAGRSAASAIISWTGRL